jgi:hypothetical protein
VGAASDALSQTSFSDSTVYFGIATDGNWTTPHSFVAQYDVLIDVNRDGTDDYRVFNSSHGNATNFITAPNSASDVFLAVVQNLSSGIYFTNNFVNYFAADVRDTAPFNNSVMALPVPVKLIGLTAENSRFNYRVRSQTPRERGPFILETSAWIYGRKHSERSAFASLQHSGAACGHCKSGTCRNPNYSGPARWRRRSHCLPFKRGQELPFGTQRQSLRH